MASPEEIRAARDFQRAHPGASFAQARLATHEADFRAENVTKLFAEIATLKAQLERLSTELHGLRITGREFSGQGPQGIIFTPTPIAPSASGIADQVITINNDTPSLVTISGEIVDGLVSLTFEWAATTTCA